MGRKVSHLIVVASQLLLVGLFFVTSFNDEIKVQKYVSTVHNENLNKIAMSVSLLFEEEVVPVVLDKEDLVLEELPSLDVVLEEEVIEKEKE